VRKAVAGRRAPPPPIRSSRMAARFEARARRRDLTGASPRPDSQSACGFSAHLLGMSRGTACVLLMPTCSLCWQDRGPTGWRFSYRDGKTLFRAPVGVGSVQWPTPAGDFYIRNKLTRYQSLLRPARLRHERPLRRSHGLARGRLHRHPRDERARAPTRGCLARAGCASCRRIEPGTISETVLSDRKAANVAR
jgi:L,D-transpeptidase catalytic domain